MKKKRIVISVVMVQANQMRKVQKRMRKRKRKKKELLIIKSYLKIRNTMIRRDTHLLHLKNHRMSHHQRKKSRNL